MITNGIFTMNSEHTQSKTNITDLGSEQVTYM